MLGFLFPDSPREFPGRRAIKIALRAVHVLCTGVLTGSYLLDASLELRDTWFLAAIVSGVTLLLFDLTETSAFLLQVRGFVVVTKIALVSTLSYWSPHEGYVLACIVLVSVVFSHAPSKVRYYMPFGGQVRGSESRG